MCYLVIQIISIVSRVDTVKQRKTHPTSLMISFNTSSGNSKSCRGFFVDPLLIPLGTDNTDAAVPGVDVRVRVTLWSELLLELTSRFSLLNEEDSCCLAKTSCSTEAVLWLETKSSSSEEETSEAGRSAQSELVAAIRRQGGSS